MDHLVSLDLMNSFTSFNLMNRFAWLGWHTLNMSSWAKKGIPYFNLSKHTTTNQTPALFLSFINFLFWWNKAGDISTPLRSAQYDVIKKRSILDDVVKKCHPERREGSPSTIHQNTQSQTKHQPLFYPLLIFCFGELKNGIFRLHFVPLNMT